MTMTFPGPATQHAYERHAHLQADTAAEAASADYVAAWDAEAAQLRTGGRRMTTIYVDDMQMPARVGRLTAKWSHLFVAPATDLEELHAFAARLGLRRSWFQGPPAHRHPHYDVTSSKRALAIKLGATPVSIFDTAAIFRGDRP